MPPRRIRDATICFIIVGVLCFASGALTAVAVVVRPDGLLRSVTSFALLDNFATRTPVFVIVQDLLFGAVCAVVFITAAIQLRRRKRAARLVLLAATIVFPILNFLFGFNQGAPQIGVALVGTVMMFQRPANQYLSNSNVTGGTDA